MKYYVNMVIIGGYQVEVDANSKDEAQVKALQEYDSADFGALKNFDMEFGAIYDENEY